MAPTHLQRRLLLQHLPIRRHVPARRRRQAHATLVHLGSVVHVLGQALDLLLQVCYAARVGPCRKQRDVREAVERAGAPAPRAAPTNCGVVRPTRQRCFAAQAHWPAR